jgi:hypothetical protein
MDSGTANPAISLGGLLRSLGANTFPSKTYSIAPGHLIQFDCNGKGGKNRYDEVECTPVLDTQKLVVGQEVSMSSGVFGCEGRVVKVTPEGVEVRSLTRHSEKTYSVGGDRFSS